MEATALFSVLPPARVMLQAAQEAREVLWHELAARRGTDRVKSWLAEQAGTQAANHADAAQAMACEQEERFVRLRHGGAQARAWFCGGVEDVMLLEAVVGKQAKSKAERVMAEAEAEADTTGAGAGTGGGAVGAFGISGSGSGSGLESADDEGRAGAGVAAGAVSLKASASGRLARSASHHLASAEAPQGNESFAGALPPPEKGRKSAAYKAVQALLQPEPSVPWAPDVDAARAWVAWSEEPLPVLPGTALALAGGAAHAPQLQVPEMAGNSSEAPTAVGAEVSERLRALRECLSAMVSSGAVAIDGAPCTGDGGGVESGCGDQPPEVVSLAWDGVPRGYSARVACRAALLQLEQRISVSGMLLSS